MNVHPLRQGSISGPSPAPEVAPATVDEWHEIVAGDPSALPEQTPQWTAAICDHTSAVDVSRVYRFADGRRFVLPLVARRGIPAVAAQLWSFPSAWGIGGPVGAHLDRHAVEHIVEDLLRLKPLRVSIRIDPVTDHLWRHLPALGRMIAVPRTAHVVELHRDAAVHLASLSRQTRYNIRRAERRGVDVRVGIGGRLLDDHYGLFLRSVDRWADQQHEPRRLARLRATRRDPLVKLQRIADHLGDRFTTVVGYVDGCPAASAIVLLGSTTRYTRGAIDAELVKGTNANDAVHWRALTLAYDTGARRYNMGDSGSAAGLSRFKERFGATPVEYGEYRIERLPLTRIDRAARAAVKKLIGFEDR